MFVLPRRRLVDALVLMRTFTTKQQPLLHGRVSGGSLLLRVATDRGSASATYSVGADVEDRIFAMNLGSLLAILTVMEDDRVEVGMGPKSVSIHAGSAKATLKLADAGFDFPELAEVRVERSRTLGQAIRAVEWAADAKAVGLAFEGVHLNASFRRAEATDRVACAVCIVEDWPKTLDRNVIVRADLLAPLVNDDSQFGLTDNHIFVVTNEVGMFVPLLRAEYPNIDGLLSYSRPDSVVVDLDPFVLLNRFVGAVRANNPYTEMTITHGGLSLRFANEEGEWVSFDADVEGEAEGRLGFGAAHLVNVVRKVGKRVEISWGAGHLPVRFANDGYIALLAQRIER